MTTRAARITGNLASMPEESNNRRPSSKHAYSLFQYFMSQWNVLARLIDWRYYYSPCLQQRQTLICRRTSDGNVIPLFLTSVSSPLFSGRRTKRPSHTCRLPLNTKCLAFADDRRRESCKRKKSTATFQWLPGMRSQLVCNRRGRRLRWQWH